MVQFEIQIYTIYFHIVYLDFSQSLFLFSCMISEQSATALRTSSSLSHSIKQTTPIKTPCPYPTLDKGEKSPYVKKLQQDLNGLGLNYDGFTSNGIYDVLTQKAISRFQDYYNLIPDGIVKEAIWNLLLAEVKIIQTH